MSEDYGDSRSPWINGAEELQKARADGYLSGRLEAASSVAKLESELTEQKRLVADAMAALVKERNLGLLIEHIVGYSDIADKFDVSVSAVQRWAERRESTQFPKPIKIMTQCHIYDMRVVQVWFDNWSSTRRQKQIENLVSKSVSTSHKWPMADEHLFTEWRSGTVHPKPTQYRGCIHPKCNVVQYRDAPKG